MKTISVWAYHKVTHYPDLYATTNPLTQNTGYVPLITEEELLLIKAEALYWKNDKAAALEAMKQAVEKSMERYGVDTLNFDGKTHNGVFYHQIYTGTYTIEGDTTRTSPQKKQCKS